MKFVMSKHTPVKLHFVLVLFTFASIIVMRQCFAVALDIPSMHHISKTTRYPA